MSSATVDMEQRTRTLHLWQLMVLVILVMAFFGHSVWLASIESNRAEHIQEVDKINIKAQQLAQYAKQASGGNVNAFDALINERRIINDTMTSLDRGGVNYPALSVAVSPQFTSLKENWNGINSNALVIIEQRERIVELAEISDKFAAEIPILQSNSDEVVKRLVAINGNRELIYLSSQQLVLADRMLRRMSEILNSGTASNQAAESLDRDAKRFQEVLNIMFNGSDDEKIAGITDQTAIQPLGEVFSAFDSVQADITTVLGAMELFDAQTAASDIEVDTELFVSNAEQLRNGLNDINQAVPSEPIGWVIAGLSFLWLLWIFRTLSK